MSARMDAFRALAKDVGVSAPTLLGALRRAGVDPFVVDVARAKDLLELDRPKPRGRAASLAPAKARGVTVTAHPAPRARAGDDIDPATRAALERRLFPR